MGVDQTMSDSRSLLRVGIGAYAFSFLLVAISGPRTRGYGCAIMALVAPLTWPPGTAGAEEVVGGHPFGYPTLFVSGLVNIVFPLAVFLKFTRYRRAFAAARIAVLLMIPFSWLVFVLLPVLPREGHVLWVAGMLLALFSEEIADRRGASSSGRGSEAPHSAPAPP
jgi:hypothetical protein